MPRNNGSQTSAQSLPALAEFKERLPRFKFQPEQESHNIPPQPAFFLAAHLRKWLASTTREGQADVMNIERVIEDAFQKRGGRYTDLPLYDIDHILQTHALVLSLLVEADSGHLIYEVRRQQINDYNLYDIHEKHLEDKLWRALEADYQNDPEDRHYHLKALFQTFAERRWAYRPHIFKYNDDPELSNRTILPVIQRQRVNRGDTAAIYQICVSEEHLNDAMKLRLDGSSFQVESVGKCYNLAVKTFIESGRTDDPAKELFNKECEAYKHLENHKGMVQYLGAYSHRNTHNILLEYGDYDLAEYFGFSPPVHPVNVCNLWHDLFDIANALSQLHRFSRVRRGRPQEIQGWHNDIKPDNILIVKGELKLADPGFAGFAQYVQGQHTPRTSVVLMSSTYGPPESHLTSYATKMPQAADMWSLGCVLSEAATWLILGPPGLTQYRTLRKDAIRCANQTQTQQNSSLPPGRTFEGDFFHNGHSVLPEISQWHQYLAGNLRKGDQISEIVLDIIDRSLLQSNPRSRYPNAGVLCLELNKIRRQFPRDQESGLTPAVDKAVTGVEARLKWEPIEALLGQSLSIQVRKALKSKGYLEFPRDGMVHLSEMIKERVEILASERPRLTLNTARDWQRLSETYVASPAEMTVVNPKSSYEMSQVTQQHTVQPNFPMVILDKRHSPYPTENIFDVHYANVEHKRLSYKGFKEKFVGTKTKDTHLAEHYENRDIKFIVDNSAGMISEWQKVRFVLEKISKKAAWIDDDGMDLEFTNRCNKVLKITEKRLVQDIEVAMSGFKPNENDETNMAEKLDSVLSRWLDKQPSPRKSMTLIVLTDGRWRRMTHHNEVEESIVKFDEAVKKLPGGKLKRRWVSIQFISFGDDPGALYRLRHLDNDLLYERKIEDIVDTEPWTGDVYKMLLGSLSEVIDGLDAGPERDDTASSIIERQNTFIPSEQEVHQYHHQPSARRERFSNTSYFQTPTRSAPRDDYHSNRLILQPEKARTEDQKRYDPIAYYRYPD